MKSLTIKILSTLFLIFISSGKQLYGKPPKNDVSYGINFNTRSYFIGGFDLRIKNARKGFYNFEIANVKHPNEVRFLAGVNSINFLGNRPFVLGKSNYLVACRVQYGLDFDLFKADESDGVSVKYILAGGLSIGLIKPYYIKYQNLSDEIVHEQYDPAIHNNADRILGPMGLFYGFHRSKILPGLNAKAGLLFDYQGFKFCRLMFETGVMIEAYPKKIELMPGAKQENIFTSVYAVISVGRNKVQFK